MKKFKVNFEQPKPLTWWRNRRRDIDMSPPYQRRGRLWSEADKAFLVDSILNGYDIPKLYIADFTWGDSPLNKKQLPYAIIDGKQRFEAIFDFFDNRLVLNKNFIYFDDPALSLGGLSYKDLQRNYPRVAEIFDVFPLHVVAIYSRDEEPINDLFVRLNRSKSLTGAEIRNAMGGAATEFIRNISKHDFFQNNIRFSTKRGADLNAAAKLLLFEHENRLVETKKSNLDKFVQRAKDAKAHERDELELSARQVLDVLIDMESVFLPKDVLLSSSGVVPVYYWFIRQMNLDDLYMIREFLQKFEEARKSNRELVKLNPTDKKIDSGLSAYDNFNRSTNDQLSHDGRIEILNSRFQEFRKHSGSK